VAVSTASVTLIDAIIAELQAHLPDALEDAGLPAVKTWDFGQRDLLALTNTPNIQVDLASAPQTAHGFGHATRTNRIIVVAVVTAPDEDTMHRYLIGYGDVICGVLEAQINPPFSVTDIDTTPSYQPRGSNALHRAVAIEAERMTVRERGAI
jgi:hypothetical protein